MKNFIKKTSTKNLFFGTLLTMLVVFISCEKEETITDLDTEFITASRGYNHNKNLQVETIAENFTEIGKDGITADKKGNLYVSIFGLFQGNNGAGTSVYKVSKNGAITDLITDISGPLGSAFDKQGNFYVIHNNNGGGSGDILKISPNGTKTTLATIEGFPAGLAFDKHNNLYVSNFVSSTIYKINKHGNISAFATDTRLAGTVGIDFDRKGNLILGNYTNADILSVNKKGTVSLIANIPDITSNGAAIGGIEVVGNVVYATGIVSNKIYKVTMKGIISVFAGTGAATSLNGELLEATFSSPNRIEFDKRTKSLYITEYAGVGIRKIKLY